MRWLTALLIPAAMLLATVPVRASSGVVAASTTSALVGESVSFTLRYTPTLAAPAFATLYFGDGSDVLVPAGVSVEMHAYASPGFYDATLRSDKGLLDEIGISVSGRVAKVPAGAIYTVTPTLSPVLAGSDIALVVTYSIAAPPIAIAADAPQLEFLVDLVDAQGRLIRRSDPFVLPPGIGGGTQIARIPYSVPVDASGVYGLRVYVRAASGGTIAVASIVPLQIDGGPDPAPQSKSSFHAKGSIELGPQITTPGTTATPASVDAGATTALVWNEASLALSGLYDPVSRRSDPLFTYQSGSTPNIQSPDATGAGSATDSFALSHGGVTIDAGRTQSSLPQLFGGGDELRGVDAVAQDGILTFHAAYGYSEVSGLGVPSQYASIFDAGAALPNSGMVRITDFDSGDSSGSASALALQYTQQPIKNLTVLASGGIGAGDSADQAQLSYAHGGSNASVLYEDSGPDMPVGGGDDALSDRASFAAQWQSQLSSITSLSLGWNSDDARSSFSRDTDGFATLAINAQTLPSITLTLRRDGESGTGIAATDDQLALGLTKSMQGWNVSFNGTLSDLNAIEGSASGTTRTGSLQFMRQMGMNTLSAGVNATDVGGAGGSAQIGETVVYGFPFACVSGRCLFQMQLEGDDANTRAAGFGGSDLTGSAILSYHVSPVAAIGLRAEIRRHNDLNPADSGTASGLHLRLDLNV
jgi:hypothetical protein